MKLKSKIIIPWEGLILLIFTCGFIVFKWQALFLPHFWDEAWSYIPAIERMSNTGPCLLPGCISTELYRGHPLFYYFLVSSWSKIFGFNLFSLHLFSIIITIGTLYTFYYFQKYLVGKTWGITGCLILMFQAVFIVQSSMVLPEIFITLLTIALLFAYLKQNFKFYILIGTILGLTKESGAVILVSVFIFHFLQTILSSKKSKGKKLIFDLAILALPIIITSSFYLYQRFAQGWYFYPLHTQLIEVSTKAIIGRTNTILSFLFYEQGRWVLLLILGGISTYKVFSKNRVFFLISTILIILGIYFGIDKKAYSVLFFIPSIIFTLKGLQFSVKEIQILFLIGIVFIFYIVFSAMNFLMLRYLVCMIPLIIIAFIIILMKCIHYNRFPYYIMGFIILFFSFYNYYDFRNRGWHDDASMNYTNVIKVHQQVVQYCENKQFHNKNIFTHFLMDVNLTKPVAGYLSGKDFNNVQYLEGIRPEVDIVIVSCIEYNESLYKELAVNPNFKLLKRFVIKKAWSEIYKRHKPEHSQ